MEILETPLSAMWTFPRQKNDFYGLEQPKATMPASGVTQPHHGEATSGFKSRRAPPLSLHGRSVISMLIAGDRRTEHGLAVKRAAHLRRSSVEGLHSGIRPKGRPADILLP